MSGRFLILIGTVAGLCAAAEAEGAAPLRPNIVYILADDLGIGDVRAYGLGGKIATPHLDRLAADGMMFLDAHSGSAVCTPTRYGILTGRYAWRTRLQSGVLWGFSMPLIEPGRMTVASLLRKHGYRTGCVGKWHLGLEWKQRDPSIPRIDSPQESWENYDILQPIRRGPLQAGFDEFFGISASLDMYPHAYIRNDRVTASSTRIIDGSTGKAFWRRGPAGDGFRHIEVLDRLTAEATEFIRQQTADTPFFLYFPLTAPHKPILPAPRFQGRSGLNEWGDFVMQVDWTVGQVMDAVSATGMADNTLFIVTSDNGATPGCGFALLRRMGHDPSGGYRGHKADIYEGGHRVPFLVRWPERVPAGRVCRSTICLTDLLATVAEILDVQLPADAGEDSVSLLPVLKQPDGSPVRETVIHHSINGSFAVRRGRWKLCLCPGSGGWSAPRPGRTQGLPPVQLYDLQNDPKEQQNLQEDHPEIVRELTGVLEKAISRGRSTPGPAQPNDRTVAWP